MAIGHGPDRERLAPALEDAGLALVTVVCAGAVIAPSAEVGRGVFVGTNAVLSTGTGVADLALVFSLACVGHHARVGRAAALVHESPHVEAVVCRTSLMPRLRPSPASRVPSSD